MLQTSDSVLSNEDLNELRNLIKGEKKEVLRLSEEMQIIVEELLLMNEEDLNKTGFQIYENGKFIGLTE